MTNIKIFEWDCETDEISCYGVLAEQSNPLILSEELRELLKNRIMNQKTPVIYQDENKVIFLWDERKNDEDASAGTNLY